MIPVEVISGTWQHGVEVVPVGRITAVTRVRLGGLTAGVVGGGGVCVPVHACSEYTCC